MAQRITIDFSEGARARKVVSRSNHRVTGKYPGLKSGRMHHWESQLEQDAFRRLDADPDVISFAEQPAKLTFCDRSGAIRVHFPDILVRDRRGKEFVEVKTDKDAASAEVVERTALLKEGLAQLGYRYRLWPEAAIRNGSLIPNMRFLLRHGRKPVTTEGYERIRRLFESSPTLPWQTVTATAHSASVARLVLDGHLHIDLDCIVVDDTPVTFTGRRS